MCQYKHLLILFFYTPSEVPCILGQSNLKRLFVCLFSLCLFSMRYNRIVGQNRLLYITLAYKIGQPKMMSASHNDGNSLLDRVPKDFP